MAAEQALAGQKILVTRPIQQSGPLAELIEQAGGEAIIFPVIDIQPVAAEQWNQQALTEYDWLIFVSRNAVEYFVKGGLQPLPAEIRLAAVGDGTAQAMHEYGLRIDLQPAQSTGSDGLLAKAAMQEMQGQNVLIVRGVGGREHLADTLSARGANIAYMEVYQRVLPDADADSLASALTADKIICTSVAGVSNLCQLLGADSALLKKRPLLVLSERIREHALSLGFEQVEVTSVASDEAIMQRLIELDG